MTIEEFVAKIRNRFSLFHFTDRRNLDSIREHGLLSLRELRRRNIEIGAPGGNDWSQKSAVKRELDQYVNLSMRDQHPMEYVATKEGRIEEVKHLKVKYEVLALPGVRFTADVSNKAGVELLTWEEAKSQLDWEVILKRTDWKDSAIQERLRQASKYEVLIPTNVPLAMIINL
ncbi:DUF4433 domain-containing protein [Mesorhizobium sp. M0340]|uniref:DarT ssDNA thymidine ADP-ribosyltransferase family protein n=1 Tax=Mesorhizobium sp. M0340 TaxID=2956939 RepID=UPI003336BA90